MSKVMMNMEELEQVNGGRRIYDNEGNYFSATDDDILLDIPELPYVGTDGIKGR